MNSKDTPSAISSQALAVGRLLSQWPDGRQLGLFGQDHARANPFRWPGLEEALKTKGISGQSSHASSATEDLQSSLESRLRRALDADGSPEYVLTWKRWDMESGPQICALRASPRRISGSGCSGWPTPNAMEGGQTSRSGKRKGEMLIGGIVAGWHTPQAHDSSPRGKGQKLKHGTKHGCGDLNADAQIAGWRTPTATDGTNGGPNSRDSSGAMHLSGQAQIAGWATPAARDWKSESATDAFNQKRDAETRGKPLSYQATLAGWSTPTAQDARHAQFTDYEATKLETTTFNAQLWHQAHGTIISSCHANQEKRGALNPDLSRWLMGYPEEHLSCGVTAMR